MKSKQFLFCFPQTKTFECNIISAQLSQLFHPLKSITLNPLFSLQERREGISSFYIENEDEKNILLCLFHSFFQLPIELQICWVDNKGTQGKIQLSQTSLLEKTPKTHLSTHVSSPHHEYQFMYQQHQSARSQEVTGTIAVKFHLIPLQDFITRSLD